MKKSKFTESQIAFVLKQAETSINVHHYIPTVNSFLRQIHLTRQLWRACSPARRKTYGSSCTTTSQTRPTRPPIKLPVFNHSRRKMAVYNPPLPIFSQTVNLRTILFP